MHSMDKVKVNEGTKVPVDQTKQRPGSAKKPSRKIIEYLDTQLYKHWLAMSSCFSVRLSS